MMRITSAAVVVSIVQGHDGADGCLAAVNKYRAMAGKSPTKLCPQEQMDVAGQVADYDANAFSTSKWNYHQWVADGKSTSGFCPQGSTLRMGNSSYKLTEGNGENEMAFPDGYSPGKAGTQDDAIHCYYQEGPDGQDPDPSGPCGSAIPKGLHDHYNQIIEPESLACVACGHSSTNNFYVHNVCVTDELTSVLV